MKIGYGICGSFCTHKRSLEVLTGLSRIYETVPVISERAASTDTRFGRAFDLTAKVRDICGREPVITVHDAEPLGPAEPLDMLVICPCTGNTLAKLANGITDSSVTMAAKATLRADKPIIIGLCSNDAMSANLSNIGTLLTRKNVYFVPMYQDDTDKKPHSLVCRFELVSDAVTAAFAKEQLMPVIGSL